MLIRSSTLPQAKHLAIKKPKEGRKLFLQWKKKFLERQGDDSGKPPSNYLKNFFLLGVHLSALTSFQFLFNNVHRIPPEILTALGACVVLVSQSKGDKELIRELKDLPFCELPPDRKDFLQDLSRMVSTNSFEKLDQYLFTPEAYERWDLSMEAFTEYCAKRFLQGSLYQLDQNLQDCPRENDKEMKVAIRKLYYSEEVIDGIATNFKNIIFSWKDQKSDDVLKYLESLMNLSTDINAVQKYKIEKHSPYFHLYSIVSTYLRGEVSDIRASSMRESLEIYSQLSLPNPKGSGIEQLKLI
jgi:hypothetical protein